MKRFIILVFILVLSQWCQAQNNLFAVLVKGDVRTVEDNNILKKGSKIEMGKAIRLAEKSALTCVDRDGNTYLTEQAGLIQPDQLLKNKKKTSSFTVKIVQVIWNELFNIDNGAVSSLIGGALRGSSTWDDSQVEETDLMAEDSLLDTYLMEYPLDSSFVIADHVMLKWEQEDMFTSSYFVFIRQKGQKDFTRIRVEDTKLDLSKQMKLGPNQAWEWAVLSVENGDVIPTYTFSFSTLTKKDIEAKIEPYKIPIEELRELGLSEEEINRFIYHTTKISR